MIKKVIKVFNWTSGWEELPDCALTSGELPRRCSWSTPAFTCSLGTNWPLVKGCQQPGVQNVLLGLPAVVPENTTNISHSGRTRAGFLCGAITEAHAQLPALSTNTKHVSKSTSGCSVAQDRSSLSRCGPGAGRVRRQAVDPRRAPMGRYRPCFSPRVPR